MVAAMAILKRSGDSHQRQRPSGEQHVHVGIGAEGLFGGPRV
jgi:hypothetical protein